VTERFPANGSAVQLDDFLFEWLRVSVVVHEVIATRPGLPEGVVPAPAVEGGYPCEAERAEGELNLAVDPVLRGIYESDLRLIPVAPVELVDAFVASVSSMFRLNRFCLLCLELSTAAETKLRQQSAERKVDYRD
jgi:hypothetical protein